MGLVKDFGSGPCKNPRLLRHYVPRKDEKGEGLAMRKGECLAMTKRAGVPRNDDEGDPAVTKKATSQ